MIKYEKTTWVDGETVLKADHMKKIEKGIVDLCAEIENITIENNHLIMSLNETVSKLSSELEQVKIELEEVKNSNNNGGTFNIYSSLTPVAINEATKTETSASFNASGYGWICLDLGDYIGKTLQISADVVMNSYTARYNEIGIHFGKSSVQSDPSKTTLDGSYYCNTIGTYTLSNTISITSNTRYMWMEGCNASYENMVITLKDV